MKSIRRHYDSVGAELEVDGQTDNIWLTKQIRVDRDYAAFGELSWRIGMAITALNFVLIAVAVRMAFPKRKQYRGLI